MTPVEITQAVYAALTDMFDCAESDAERELLIGLALNIFEQCQEVHESEDFSEQIQKMREELAETAAVSQSEANPALAETALV